MKYWAKLSGENPLEVSYSFLLIIYLQFGEQLFWYIQQKDQKSLKKLVGN